MKDLKLIAAVSVDGAIGNDNQLIWHLPPDLKRYKARTMGNIVIVGLNTFMGMPIEAFKGRTAIIVCGDVDTSKLETQEKNVFVVKTPEDAIKKAEKIRKEDQEVFVIGGEQLYNSMIDKVEEAEITWINNMYPEANKRFPIDKLFNDFDVTGDSSWVKAENKLIYKFTYYKRSA